MVIETGIATWQCENFKRGSPKPNATKKLYASMHAVVQGGVSVAKKFWKFEELELLLSPATSPVLMGLIPHKVYKKFFLTSATVNSYATERPTSGSNIPSLLCGVRLS